MKTQGCPIRSFFSVIYLIPLCPLLLTVSLQSAGAGPAEPNLYYYSSGRKISLPLSKEKIAVRFKPQATLEQRRAAVESEQALGSFFEREDLSLFDLTILPLRPDVADDDVAQTVTRLESKQQVVFASPFFTFTGGQFTLTDEFIVKFKPSVSRAQVESLNGLHNVQIAQNPLWPGRYILRVKDATNLNTLTTANIYYESPLTEYAVPNFIMKLELPSVIPDDFYFDEQWLLDNDGNVPPPGGTADADIDAPEGWEITTGSSEIVIAVIDQGVDPNHEDLIGKLVEGRNFALNEDEDPNRVGDSNWGPLGDGAHGTACAGLAAADSNNAMGIAGVSPNCRIMPIRIFGGLYWEVAWPVYAIRWAADNGADVLSNSWGCGPNDDIHQAIMYAKDTGRDGKGCIIVFAAGNEGRETVSYPARLEETIAVGATDQNDVKWDYSNSGDELNVVAPSGACGGHPLDKERVCWAPDISGMRGYNPGKSSEGDTAGNYYKWFGGTSAATPHVAGLAGLILSVDPTLDSNEVQSVIESTADDLGETGWDPNYGWGRINVYTALLEAIPSKGNIDLDRDYYNCDDTISIFLADSHLADQNNVDVNITTSGSDSEIVSLTEIGLDIGVFTGEISTESNDPCVGDSVLQVAHGETVTVTYEDVNDGTGNPASPNDTATVDCVCPVIYEPDFNKAPIGPDITVTFDTNESTIAHVLCGTSCGGAYSSSTWSRGTSHTVKLVEPTPWTDYYFIIEATDTGGNSAVDNNDANCYRLTTDGPQDLNVPADYSSIQDAIDRSWDGSSIIVAPGTYYESPIYFKGKAITVRSTNPDDWDVVAATIIEPNGVNYTVWFIRGEDPNSILTGLTLRNSQRSAVYCSRSSPAISNCIIENNRLSGILCYTKTSLIIKNNKIRNNDMSGIHLHGLSVSTPPIIMDNWLYNNHRGGIFLMHSLLEAVVSSNTIVGNNGFYGIWGGDSSIISNCIIWDNDDELYRCSATYSCIKDPNDANGVGNISGDANDPMFVNIYDFRDETDANGTTTTIIVADANLYDVNHVIEYDDDGIVRTVTDVNTTSETITFDNPLDANSVVGTRIHNWGSGATDLEEDLHIEADSPCIDAGDPNGDYAGQTDIDGNCRDVNGVDIGADEVCVPTTYSTYDDWVTLGKPDCWCQCYQCDGDADGSTEDPNNYRIYDADLDLIIANWQKTIDDPNLDPCADIDHKPYGYWKYRVFTPDLTILTNNWKKTDEELDGNCPRSE